MPHVIVKLGSGRPESEKVLLADEITKAVVAALKCEERLISVGIGEVDPSDWNAAVYEPDIVRKSGTLYRKPGYGTL